MPKVLHQIASSAAELFHPGASLPPISTQRFDGPEVLPHNTIDRRLSDLYSLDEVERTLDRTFETTPSTDDMERFVHHLGTTAQLGHLIENIASDPDRLDQIAANSERHPLGFDKITLAANDYQLRLNIWPDRREIPLGTASEDIHNHRFDFSSAVVAGKLATWVYEFTDEPPLRYFSIPTALEANDPVETPRTLEWLHEQSRRISMGLREEHHPKPVWIYDADHQPGREGMTLRGKGYARLLANSVVMGPGATYSLSHNTYHTAHSATSIGPTATLFLRGPLTIQSDTIARTAPTEAKTDRPKERLTPQQVAGKLTSLLDILV